MKKTGVNFISKLDNVCKFYGVDNLTFKLDYDIYEAIEDPDDGYRSLLRCVRLKNSDELIFFRKSIAQVSVLTSDEEFFEGYEFRDIEDGHMWLKIGTDYADEYYPCFVFRYTPKPGH